MFIFYRILKIQNIIKSMKYFKNNKKEYQKQSLHQDKDLKYKLTRESFKKIIKDELMILKTMKFKILKKIQIEIKNILQK